MGERDQSSEEYSDEQLEEIYQKLHSDQSLAENDADAIRRGRKALDLINRVREQNRGDTVKESIRNKATNAENGGAVSHQNGEIPQVIGHFEIKKLLGHGGFAVVYLARDRDLDRDVALKIPRASVIGSPELRARFIREGKAAASLAHPNIVPVYEAGQAESQLFIASQYVDGITLAEWLDKNREKLTQEDIAQVTATLAEALAHAHQRSVIHRDIKPLNILVMNQKEGENKSLASRLRITDFGLAKNVAEADTSLDTQAGAIVGTPAFMSPEQVDSKDEVGPWTDLYSLGSVLYLLLAGKVPFSEQVEKNLFELLRSIKETEPDSIRRTQPKVARDLEAICFKCLEKLPSNRYQTGFELADDCRRWIRGESIMARNAGPIQRLMRWANRNRSVATWISATIAALVLGLMGTTTMYFQSQKHLAESQKQTEFADASLDRTQRSIDTILNNTSAVLKGIPEMDELRNVILGEALKLNLEILEEQEGRNRSSAEAIESYSRLAKLQYELGKRDEALVSAAQALQVYNKLGPQERNTDTMVSAWGTILEIQILLERERGDSKKVKELTNKIEERLEHFPSKKATVVHLRANILWQKGISQIMNRQTEQAIVNFDQAMEIMNQAELEGENSHFQKTFHAKCANSKAIALKTLGRYEEAKKAYEEIIELLSKEGLHSEILTNKELLATVSVNLGNLQFSRQDYSAAESSYQRAVDDWTGLQSRFPKRVLYHNRLASSVQGLGIAQKRLGKKTEAVETLRASISLANEFESKYGESPSIAQSKSNAYSSIAMLLNQLGDLEQARKSAAQAVEIKKKLVRKFPDSVSYRNALAVSVGTQGDIELFSDNYEKAVEFHNAALQKCRVLMTDFPNQPDCIKNARFQIKRLAQDYLRLEDHQNSIKFVEELAKLGGDSKLGLKSAIALAESLKRVDEADRERGAENPLVLSPQVATIFQNKIDEFESRLAEIDE